LTSIKFTGILSKMPIIFYDWRYNGSNYHSPLQKGRAMPLSIKRVLSISVLSTLSFNYYTLAMQSTATPAEAPTLHRAAAAEDNVAQLETLLAQERYRAKIDELSQDARYLGLSPLHVAINEDHLGAVGVLLAHGANIETTDNVPTKEYYATPLALAIEKGSLPIVMLLLERGASAEHGLFYNWHTGLYPLHIAARCGNLDIVRALLEHGARVLRKEGLKWKYPLHFAVEHDSVDLVRALIEVPGETFYCKWDTAGFFLLSPFYWQGAGRTDQNRLNYINDTAAFMSGRSPLSIAASKGNTAVVKFLLTRGANNLEKALSEAIIHFNDNPESHMKTIRALIDAGANVAAVEDALSAAVSHGATEELVRLLVSHNADRSGVARGGNPMINYWIACPLHEAAEAGNLEQVKRLLQTRGFHANMQDGGHLAPLYWAALRGHINIIEFLLQQGAQIGATYGRHAISALYVAAGEGKEEAVRFLCAHQADVNQENASHDTPLDAAAHNGHLNVVRALVEVGANISHVNVNNQVTPLLRAIQNNHQDVAQFLIDHDARVDQGDPLGEAIVQIF
jgi:ankyrin repeat protein